METWELAAIALALVAFSAMSGRLGRSVVTPAMFFTATGLVAGPVLGLLDLPIGSETIKLVAETTLTLVLFADASRIAGAGAAPGAGCRSGCSRSACR